MAANTMTSGDVPSISGSTYTTNTVPIDQTFIGNALGWVGNDSADPASDLWENQQRAIRRKQIEFLAHPDPSPEVKKPKKQELKLSRRIVQVFIADTDENVPLDKSVIYSGTQKLTDCTDQELFFEIEIKKLLDSHNEYRKTLINKKVKERTENLEPVKIRDLKMVVVTVAEFK